MDGTYFDYDDMEAHVMQRLATACYFHRREMQRYPRLNASQVIDYSSVANGSLTLPTFMNLPNFYHGSSHSDLPISVVRSIDNAQPPSSDPDVNIDSPFKSRVFFKQLPPDNPRRPSPSEIFSFSEFVKLKWSAASARYKELISKGTCSLKERLLSQNTSVKELSKDVECEISAGIAGVAKMIERLDLASKCRISTPSSVNVFLRKRIGKTIQNIAEALCSEKGSVSQGSLISKVLKRVAKYCAATTMIVETNQENSFESWDSYAQCCADHFPETSAFLVIQKGRIISTTRSVLQLRGFRLLSKPEFYIKKKSASSGNEVKIIKSNSPVTSEDALKADGEDLNDQNSNLTCDRQETISLRSISQIQRELPESSLGWPLLRRSNQNRQVLSRLPERNMSVVEWAISLHSRSSSIASQGNKIEFDCTKTDSTDSSLERDNEFSTRQIIHSTEDASTDGGRNSIDEEKYRNPCASEEACTVREGISIDQNEEYTSTVDYGWPLLLISAPETSDSLRDCEDKTLLNQSTSPTPYSQINSFSPKTKNPFQMDIPCSEGKYDENTLTPSTELFLKLVSSRCRQFSYEELKQATSQFSSDNLIGEGGCSNVYKGCLSDGKQAAVKVLRSYKEAWNDFSSEVDITSSLEQKSITTLKGVCIEDNYLILVSDFLPKGSLEESLHGAGEQSVLPWGVRFEVAVAIAEALNYLHSECSRPVIHRDVKSSNILLSSDFQPQLSDFGLAIWGPTDSTHMIREDVVGTFGYIAPEYLMHGKVSDKIDVYSFGVVLLELLSGRRPIGFKNLKGPESLVKWAKPLLKNGDTETLLDPKLSNEYDNAQMQRMLFAANLCINQSPQLRPNMGQVLKLLRGETHATDWVDRHADDIQGSGIQEDDDCQIFSSKPHLDFPILDIDLEATSPSSIYTKSFSGTGEKPTSLTGTERTQHRKLKDYLKEEQD